MGLSNAVAVVICHRASSDIKISCNNVARTLAGHEATTLAVNYVHNIPHTAFAPLVSAVGT